MLVLSRWNELAISISKEQGLNSLSIAKVSHSTAHMCCGDLVRAVCKRKWPEYSLQRGMWNGGVRAEVVSCGMTKAPLWRLGLETEIRKELERCGVDESKT